MENFKSGVDALFIMTGAIMVLAMHAGFAFLELGTVRKKNRSDQPMESSERNCSKTGLFKKNGKKLFKKRNCSTNGKELVEKSKRNWPKKAKNWLVNGTEQLEDK